MDTYNPATISTAEAMAIIARVDRYIRRHGSEYGETPVPGGDCEEARGVILADWQGADWEALEWTYVQRNGRPLFTPDLSDMGRHLRAVLFIAGRAKRRGWVMSASDRRAARAAVRRREMDDSPGASMASRAVDPARIVEAVEEAQKHGMTATPVDDQGKRLRWMKTRNSTGYTVEVVRREHDRTVIDIRPFTRYNFRQIGKCPLRIEDNSHYKPVHGIGRVVRSRPNPAIGRTRRRVPAGWTADALREAITG
ncbi:MAG: hypothetical protein RL328_2528 [Acidobacteriota bacterium]